MPRTFIENVVVGRVVNEVVARWARVSSFEAGDVTLVSTQPINFGALPPDPSELTSYALLSLRLPERLSIFQELLPLGLLEKELTDIWLKTPVFARTLSRLKGARVVPIPEEVIAGLSS